MTSVNEPTIFVLPCDHRDILRDMWETTKPKGFTKGDDWVTYAKHLVLDGILMAVDKGLPKASVALLMEEELGSPVLQRARDHGITRLMPVDDGTVGPYTIQFGTAFPDHVEAVDPDFVQTLINYNPDAPEGPSQIDAIQPLIDWLGKTDRKFMLELQVLPTEAQLEKGRAHFVTEMRPALIIKAIDNLIARGADPELWKVEQLASDDNYDAAFGHMTAASSKARAVILGGGADTPTVDSWLRQSARNDGFIGFAVGRSTWAEGITKRANESWTAAQSVEDIANKYMHFAKVFLDAKAAE